MKTSIFERWSLFAFFPLVLLAIHFFNFPYLFSSIQEREIPNSRNLVRDHETSVGRYNGHAIKLALGDFQNPDFLRNAGSTSAVVIAHFIETPGAATQTSGAGRSILRALGQNSPTEVKAYLEFLRETSSASPGDVEIYKVISPVDALFDAIFIVMLNKSDSAKENRDSLTTGFKHVFDAANNLEIDTLFLPTLTVDPRHQNSVGERQYFELLFNSLPQSRYPEEILISLYNQSPTEFLTLVLSGFRSEWTARFASDQPWVQRLFRLELRSALLLLSLCLFVSATKTILNLKNTLIISIAYLGAVAATTKTIRFVLMDQSEHLVILVVLVVQILLALFLYAFVYWDPKAVFSDATPK